MKWNRYRCPKTGRYIGEFSCMMCSKPPKGFKEVGMYCIRDGKKYSMYYDYCFEYNTGQDMSMNE